MYMLNKRNLAACAGAAAAIMALAVPASASASTAKTVALPRGFTLTTCSGSVFSNVDLQNQSYGYLAQSVADSNAVLYPSTTQRWDGYRDSAGHLVIYKCGTNDALTDVVGAKCRKNFKDCLSVESYNDAPDQWWTRVFTPTVWSLQTLDPAGDNKVVDDPDASTGSGVQLVMSTYVSSLPNERFNVHT
ncbi:MAG TPA: hypothetical protein VGH27_15265 [Streptosporangiaceae bacterium]